MVVTGPLTLITSYITTNMSLATDNENMACFADPEVYKNGLVFNWVVNQLFLCVIAYWARLVTLERFIDHTNSVKQQD